MGDDLTTMETVLLTFGGAFMSAGMFAIVVCILFFTLGKMVENRIVTDQVNRLIESSIPKPLKPYVRITSPPPDLSREDAKAASYNTTLLFKAIGFVIIIVLGCLLVNGMIYLRLKDTALDAFIHKTLVEPAILTAVVVVTYISFTLKVPINYVSMDEQVVKAKVLESILGTL